MKPREIATLGAPLIGIAVLVWWLGADELAMAFGAMLTGIWLVGVIVLFTLNLPLADSTMGSEGDSIVGFEARVVTAEPLQVEVHGSVWRAQLVEGASVSPEERVRVVGRQVLTLLVARGK